MHVCCVCFFQNASLISDSVVRGGYVTHRMFYDSAVFKAPVCFCACVFLPLNPPIFYTFFFVVVAVVVVFFIFPCYCL